MAGARYVSKPAAIDAVRWTGENQAEVLAFAPGKVEFIVSSDLLRLLAGKDGAQEWVPVPVGHWLVMKPNDPSDIWPIDPDYFADKYRKAA